MINYLANGNRLTSLTPSERTLIEILVLIGLGFYLDYSYTANGLLTRAEIVSSFILLVEVSKLFYKNIFNIVKLTFIAFLGK